MCVGYFLKDVIHVLLQTQYIIFIAMSVHLCVVRSATTFNSDWTNGIFMYVMCVHLLYYFLFLMLSGKKVVQEMAYLL